MAAQELLPQFSREGTFERVNKAIEMYEADLPGSIRQAQSEIRMWLDEVNGLDNKELSLSQCVGKAREMCLPSVVTLLRLFGVIPTTTASSERSFSHLRRLKTYLRSTMGSERLNGLALMACHRDIDVDINTIIDNFRDAKPRRIQL